MGSLAFLPLRCPSNSLIMASFYILVLIYASCGTLWICWLSPVPSRPSVWTCCKSFTFYTPVYSPQLGKMFCELAFSSFTYCDLQVLLKNRSSMWPEKNPSSQFFPLKNMWSCILIIVIYRFCLEIDLQCDQKKSKQPTFPCQKYLHIA